MNMRGIRPTVNALNQHTPGLGAIYALFVDATHALNKGEPVERSYITALLNAANVDVEIISIEELLERLDISIAFMV